MKLAHLAVVTPKRCGLYETTRELVVALRKNGIDSRIVDPTYGKNTLHPKTEGDRGAPLEKSMEFARGANFLINHSGYDGTPLQKVDIPVIHIAHGRPRSSFLSEVNGGTPIYTYHYNKNSDPRFKAIVTFWEQHRAYLDVMFPDKPVRYVPPPVDLEAWSPEGPSGYRFNGKKGKINVICTDAWRDDIDPFEAVMAFALWARHQDGAKLHIYGNNKIRKGWSALIKRIMDDGNMGEWLGWVGGLDNVYRAANMVITPHLIDTRTVREAMACGCPVVRIQHIERDQTRMTFAKNANRQRVRAEAERQFDPKVTAEAFIRILNDVEAIAA